MKVGLYLGGTGIDGGTYQYALSLLQALARISSDRYEVVAFYARDEWKERCDALGVPALPVPGYTPVARVVSGVVRLLPISSATKWLNSRIVPFGRLLRRERVDVCIYPNFEHYSFELATPSIGAIHDLMHIHEPEFPEVSAGDIPRRRDRLFSRIYRGSTVTVVDSELGKQHVIDAYGGTGDSIAVLPYSVPSYIVESSEDDTAAEQFLALLPDRYLFYPAQFWPHKNHLRLIEALARVRESAPDIHLALAGSPKAGYDDVLAAIKRLDAEKNVTLLGYVPDAAMPGLYRHARALVYPCMFGPTGIPPIEAQALECAVACADIYAFPEQLGAGALLFDPRSVDAIASALETVWSDDEACAHLVRAGSANAERLSPQRFDLRLAEVIEAAAARSGRRTD